MGQANDVEYRRRVRAWTLYDWANSAFATTILAGILPIYYSKVAGATLASKAVATGYWATGLTISLVVVAVLSPILGTISDVMRGKKRFLSIAAGIGILATGLLFLADTGDWMLASILFIVGRVGFASANVFYDALLPHVAREGDQDRVSTRGYAAGYLGGGILLAVNAATIHFLADAGTLAPRLCFVSVAVWWALFSIPLLRRVPEPRTASAPLAPGQGVVTAGFRQLAGTFRQLRRFRELGKFLIAFLIYNDGIGTIIAIAMIYVAELGFGTMESIGALLLVQLVGIPYALLFGRIPGPGGHQRPFLLAYVVLNVVALPVAGILGARLLPAPVTGRSPSTAEVRPPFAGEGAYDVEGTELERTSGWTLERPAVSGEAAPSVYAVTGKPGERITLRFHGRKIDLIQAQGPDHGAWRVTIDGQPPWLGKERVTRLDAYRATPRLEEGLGALLDAGEVGEHVLVLESGGTPNPKSTGMRLALARVEVFARESHLGAILAFLVLVQLACAGLAFLLGPLFFGRLARAMDTKRTILLALAAYVVIASWGYFLDAVLEFWFLAWMVAVVQGGSQALSRSLYAHMSPATKSGEFFGFFTVMSKFSAALGPLLFAVWALSTDSSRPAILSLVAFFVLGGVLLSRVDVAEGHRVAREADAAARGA